MTKKTTVLFLAMIIFTTAAGVFAAAPDELVKVEAQADKGFSYPYYLYIPAALRENSAKNNPHSLLVIPNNTGKLDDDLNIHEQNVKQKMTQAGFVFGRLSIPVLMPVFPRPQTDWKIYTHALDRDALLTEKSEYKRFDLQLAAMIEHTRQKLAKENLKVDEKVLLYGYSAAGMFVNRFAFLHPDKVKAVASGAPGGWAIAPTEKVKDRTLRYPIGTADFKTVTGVELNLKSLQTIPFFIFMGEKDENDSLVFNDGYEDEDKNLVFELFGNTPFARWETSRKLYQDAKLNAEFKLYQNTDHKVTPEMLMDVLVFLEKNKAK